MLAQRVRNPTRPIGRRRDRLSGVIVACTCGLAALFVFVRVPVATAESGRLLATKVITAADLPPADVPSVIGEGDTGILYLWSTPGSIPCYDKIDLARVFGGDTADLKPTGSDYAIGERFIVGNMSEGQDTHAVYSVIADAGSATAATALYQAVTSSTFVGCIREYTIGQEPFDHRFRAVVQPLPRVGSHVAADTFTFVVPKLYSDFNATTYYNERYTFLLAGQYVAVVAEISTASSSTAAEGEVPDSVSDQLARVLLTRLGGSSPSPSPSSSAPTPGSSAATGGQSAKPCDSTVGADILKRALARTPPIAIPARSVSFLSNVAGRVSVSFSWGDANLCDHALSPLFPALNVLDSGHLVVSAEASGSTFGPWTYEAGSTGWLPANIPTGVNPALTTEFEQPGVEAKLGAHFDPSDLVHHGLPGLTLASVTLKGTRKNVILANRDQHVLEIALGPSISLDASVDPAKKPSEIDEVETDDQMEGNLTTAEQDTAEQMSDDVAAALDQAGAEYGVSADAAVRPVAQKLDADLFRLFQDEAAQGLIGEAALGGDVGVTADGTLADGAAGIDALAGDGILVDGEVLIIFLL